MGSIQVPDVSAAVTVNGTAAGYITVGSTTGFQAGAICHISDGTASVKVQIANIGGGGANTIGLRRLPPDPGIGEEPWNTAKSKVTNPQYGWGIYGQTDATQFTTSWTLYQGQQSVAVPRTAL